MDISVVVPLFNEEESLPELYAWIERVMQANGFSFEVIFVNDGSTDRSWEVIEKLKTQSECVKGIKFRRNYGKSPALYCGFAEAQGDVVITMDADLQDSPDEIPELYRMITEDGYDLVSGWKQKRYDPISKTLPTKLFNATARKVSGIKNLHDFNCGLKAYRKEVIKHIEVYGEMHRYIPYLAKNAGFKKIGEKVVHHQARKYGTTKFGLNRFVNGYLDLLSLWFLSKFGIKPMHFFGLLGSLMFLIGMISVIIVGVSKLYAMYNGLPYRLVTDSPYFYLSLTAMIIGTQLFLAGFLGELISRNAPERNNYQIEKENLIHIQPLIMKNLIRIFLILLIVGGAISIHSSCSDENDCSLAGRPMMYCTFKSIDKTLVPNVIANDTLDSLTITALGTDSIILNNEKKVHKVMLPLRYTSDSTIFILRYDPVRNWDNADTLYIVQQNTPYFQSMECGYMMKQNIISAKFGNKTNSAETIDSIYLRNKEANTNEIENLQIFFIYRERTPDEETN